MSNDHLAPGKAEGAFSFPGRRILMHCPSDQMRTRSIACHLLTTMVLHPARHAINKIDWLSIGDAHT